MLNYLLDLTELDGDNGFVVSGKSDRWRAGVSNGGDINGDGFDDLILTAPFAEEPNVNPQQINYDEGKVYVIFGSNRSFTKNLDLNSLDGNNGFVVRGLNNGDNLGEAASGAGDINGDGFDDLIIGAPHAGETLPDPDEFCYSCEYNYRGEVYTIFGSDRGFANNLDLNSLDGSNGFVIKGLGVNDRLGSTVSIVGDINSDGFDDFIVGAPNVGESRGEALGGAADYTNDRGAAYVIFGSDRGFAADFALASLDGSNGFVIKGLDKFDKLGDAISKAGDINGDGLDDFVIAAPYAGGTVTNGRGSYSDYRGEAYVIFGRKSGFAATLDLNSLSGKDGFVIRGVDENDLLGLSNAISNAGDVNGDGFDDLIIGAFFASVSDPFSGEGEAYIVFGSDKGFTTRLDLNTLDGSNGFAVRGLNNGDNLGQVVSGAGDINGDGFDDVIISAPNVGVSARYSSEGEVYVIFGSDKSFAPVFALANLSNNEGFAIQGLERGNFLGRAVSNAGDVNGDGLDDLVIGASDADVNDDNISQAQAYIIFGFRALELIGTAANDTLTGGAGNDTLTSLGGNDRLEGLGAADTLLGGAGNDIILAGSGNDIARGKANNDSIDGGNGDDTIQGGLGNDVLNGEAGNDSLDGAEGDDTIAGGFGNDNILGRSGNDFLEGNKGEDILEGDAGADTLNGGENSDLLLGGDGDDVYISKITESAGDIIQDTNGNDTIKLLTDTDTEVDISLTQPTTGKIGISKQENSLIIDLDANGVINPELDLTISDFFNRSSAEKGFIEQVANLSGEDILNFYSDDVALSLTGGTAQIAYVAYYGRPGDKGGLEFWNDSLSENNVSYAPREGDSLTGQEQQIYNDIVNQFGTAAEAERLFGEFNNNRDKINRVYQFAFNRDGDSEGLNFWTEQIELGNVTLATFALEVALGAQNEDIVVLNNKIESADLFTNSIDTQAEINAYQGSDAEIFGRSWLGNYGSTVSSQSDVNSALNELAS